MAFNPAIYFFQCQMPEKSKFSAFLSKMTGLTTLVNFRHFTRHAWEEFHSLIENCIKKYNGYEFN